MNKTFNWLKKVIWTTNTLFILFMLLAFDSLIGDLNLAQVFNVIVITVIIRWHVNEKITKQAVNVRDVLVEMNSAYESNFRMLAEEIQKLKASNDV